MAANSRPRVQRLSPFVSTIFKVHLAFSAWDSTSDAGILPCGLRRLDGLGFEKVRKFARGHDGTPPQDLYSLILYATKVKNKLPVLEPTKCRDGKSSVARL